MKKAILVLMVLAIVSILCAFPKGTINPGGTVYFSSEKDDSDAKALTTFAIMPQVGYFFIDNLSADLLFNYINQSQDDESLSQMEIGLGGRYFFNKLYGGLGFLHSRMEYDYDLFELSGSANYLELKGGYLIQPARNVYLDLGLKYRFGLGDYGGDMDGKNEETKLMIGAGLQIFYHTDVLGK